MENVPFTEDEIRDQCQRHLAGLSKRANRDKDNFLVLKEGTRDSSFAIKIASDFDRPDLQYDLAFMQFLEKYSSSSSKRYTFPTGYGIVEDGGYSYLVMKNLEGKTMWELMNNGAQALSDADADDIAAALSDLRKDQALCQPLLKEKALTPLGYWHPQSPIFGYDNDGGRLVDDWTDFERFMTVRFREAKVDLVTVPLSPCVLTHGEPSPHNLKRCPDGTIGILDLRTMFVAPFWWEFYALHASKEDSKYTEPLKKAMIKHGMGINDKIQQELDNKFIPWFGRLGAPFARRERRERRMAVQA